MTTDADVLAAVNVENFPDGEAVILEAMFGNSATYNSSGAVTGATAMLQVTTSQTTYYWLTLPSYIDACSVAGAMWVLARSSHHHATLGREGMGQAR